MDIEDSKRRRAGGEGTLGLGQGYWKRWTLQKSSATATTVWLWERHSALMSVPSEPSSHTPGTQTVISQKLQNHPAVPEQIEWSCSPSTYDMEAQHTGIGGPLPVSTLKAVPQQFAASCDVPWWDQNHLVTSLLPPLKELALILKKISIQYTIYIYIINLQYRIS